ncbi:MAG TPA: response regulator [Candidatus Thermoplasmatota archaeon]|nr:response regulator [Candidatus Thermoplasmatota archaeon]
MPTMLAVDDEPDILQALAAFLEATVPGLQVVTVSSGPAALETLAQGRPDIILSDYKMPGMSGIELLAEVARRHPGLPCLLMTAYADTELAMRAVHEAHVRQFLTKPVDPQRLAAVVKGLLREG